MGRPEQVNPEDQGKNWPSCSRPTLSFSSLSTSCVIHALMNKHSGIEPPDVRIRDGAALVVEIVLLADLMPFINRFPAKPCFGLLWKTTVIFLCGGNPLTLSGVLVLGSNTGVCGSEP